MGKQFDMRQAVKVIKILKRVNKEQGITVHMLKEQNEWLSTPTLNNGIFKRIGLWFTLTKRGLTNVKSSQSTAGRTSSINCGAVMSVG